jgi:hypothetical protein
MATYQIWGDITKLADDRFFITVSAVPAHERTQERTGGVTTAEAKTLEEAQTIRDDLVLKLGKTLRERGHVIVNVLNE